MNYTKKANKIIQVIFDLVDAYIVLWIKDKNNTEYIKTYNTPVIRMQIHVETFFYFMFYVDMLAFSKLGANKRGMLMDKCIVNMKETMTIKYKEMLDSIEITQNDLNQQYNARIAEYATAYIKYKNKESNNHEAWIYGKIISKALTNDTENYTTIMNSITHISAFMKYFFWKSINPLFN